MPSKATIVEKAFVSSHLGTRCFPEVYVPASPCGRLTARSRSHNFRNFGFRAPVTVTSTFTGVRTIRRTKPNQKRRWRRLSVARFLRRLRRRSLAAPNRIQRSRDTKGVPATTVRRSGVLGLFATAGELQARRGSGASRIVRLPEVFSLGHNTDPSLQAVAELAGYCLDRSTRTVWIDQRSVKTLGYGADCLMAALAGEASQKFRIRFNGLFPHDPDLRDIVRATGVPRALGMVDGVTEGFRRLSLLHGRREATAGWRSTSIEYAATHCTAYLNECLEDFGVALSPVGEELFAGLLGEVLTNAVEHSQIGEWWMSGYLRQRESGDYGECRIVIFNLGDTIFQSMQRLPVGAPLRNEIQQLIDHHRRWSFFKSGSWTPESLWTVYALQGGVSRFHNGERMGHRGTGTVRMIEFFQELSSSRPDVPRPEMTILSGGTLLRFDGTYRMQPAVTISGQTRSVIAFNDENDLGKPPNRNYVLRRKRSFPGTMVSMAFYLDRRHLAEMQGENNESHP